MIRFCRVNTLDDAGEGNPFGCHVRTINLVTLVLKFSVNIAENLGMRMNSTPCKTRQTNAGSPRVNFRIGFVVYCRQ